MKQKHILIGLGVIAVIGGFYLYNKNKTNKPTVRPFEPAKGSAKTDSTTVRTATEEEAEFFGNNLKPSNTRARVICNDGKIDYRTPPCAGVGVAR